MPLETTNSPLIDHAGRLTKRAWAVLLVLCGALFLDALDVSMIGVALPSIESDLGLSTSSLQWIVSAYVLGYGGFLLLGGRAADLLGRRRVFLIALGVFTLASALGGVVDNGALLIATRLIKGISAAFTAPAGLSIITTSFPEGPVRNKALSVYTATGATGFSLGLVMGGALTQIGWRLVFLVPVVIAMATLVGALRIVPRNRAESSEKRSFDSIGALLITAGMLSLVFTLVDAPNAGWLSLRTILSFVIAAFLLTAFVVREHRTEKPLVRLGIFRSKPLVRANFGAMSLFGGWVGFQFLLTLYMQQLRHWSALETGLAIFPAGIIVAVTSTKIDKLVERFGTTRLIVGGLASMVIAYTLFLPISLTSSYVFAMLPTFMFSGLGFGLAFGPLNIAATNGVAEREQGLAGGLVNTSFQFGGALVLALTTAVISAHTETSSSPRQVLDAYKAGVFVSLGVAVLGLLASIHRASKKQAHVQNLEQTEASSNDCRISVSA